MLDQTKGPSSPALLFTQWPTSYGPGNKAGRGATAPSHPCSPATGARRLIASNPGDSTQPSGLITIDSLCLQEFIQPPFSLPNWWPSLHLVVASSIN